MLRVTLLAIALACIAITTRAAECPATAKYPGSWYEWYQPAAQAGKFRLMQGLGPVASSTMENGHSAWAHRLQELHLPGPSPDLHDRCFYGLALQLLEERVRRFGPEHPYVRDWVQNQETVYSNCRVDRPAVNLPVRSSAVDAADLADRDLAFQTAAALFYGRRGAAALAAFDGIAGDSTSPYRDLGRYMRLFISRVRDGATAAQLSQLLADPSMAQVRWLAADLRNAIAWHTLDLPLLQAQIRQAGAILALPAETLAADLASQSMYRTALEDLPVFIHPPSNEEGLADGWWLENYPLPWHPRAEAIREAARGSEILDWLQTMSRTHPRERPIDWPLRGTSPLTDRWQSLQHALTRWRGGEGIEWAVAAAPYVEPLDPAADELLALFTRLEDRSRSCTLTEGEAAAYEILFGEALRLRLQRGEIDGAIDLLRDHSQDERWYVRQAITKSLQFLLSHGETAKARDLLARFAPKDLKTRWEYGDASSLTTIGQILAPDLDEFLRFGKMGYGWSNSAALLNLLPVRELAHAADSPHLEPETRAMVLRVAWTRAYLLRDFGRLDSLTRKLRESNPELAPFLDLIGAARSLRQRDHMILYMLLKNPRMSPRLSSAGILRHKQLKKIDPALKLQAIDIYSHNDNNWWCSFDIESYRSGLDSDFFADAGLLPKASRFNRWAERQSSRYVYYGDSPALWPPGNYFPTEPAIDRLLRTQPVFKLIDWEELRRLAAVDNGPKLLSERTIAWATSSTMLDRLLGRDDLLPEALHLAVRATRYGCNRDGGHARHSRRAFQILHRRFGSSEWAEKTPYWFDCIYGPGRCPRYP